MKKTFSILIIALVFSLSGFAQSNLLISETGDNEPQIIYVEKDMILADFMNMSQFRDQFTDINSGIDPEGDYMLRSCFSTDGTKFFVVTGQTQNVTVYDFETMETIAVIPNLSGYPVDIAATDDYAIVPSLGGYIHVIDLSDYSVNSIYTSSDVDIVAVETSSDGHYAYVATGGEGESGLSVLDLETMTINNIGEIYCQLTSFSFMATGGRTSFKYSRFVVSSDDNYLIYGNNDNSVVFTNTSTGDIDFSVDGIPGCITVGLSGDGTKTIAVSYDWNAGLLQVFQIDNATHAITGTVEVTGYSLRTNEVAVNADGSKAYIGVSSNSSALVRFETSDFTAYSQNYTPFWLGTSPDHHYAVHGQNRFSIFDFETESFSDNQWGNSQSFGAVSPVDFRVAGYDPLRYEGVYFYDCTNPDDIVYKGKRLAGMAPEGDTPYRIAVSPDGTKAVSVNGLSESVSIIDMATYTVDTILDMGENCWEVAITHDSHWAVLGGYDMNSIKIIDLTSNEYVTSVTTGQRPMMLQISPDDNYVYVGNLKSNSVSIVQLDGADSQVLTTIPTGIIGISFTAFGIKSGVQLDPSGQYLAVAASFDDKVQIIDVEQQQIVADLPVGDFPLQIAFNASGEYAAVTNRFDNTFSIIHIEGASSTVLGTFPSGGEAPSRLAYNPIADEFGIINYNSKNVVNVNPETGNINSTDSYASFGYPAQMIYDEEGLPIVITIADGEGSSYIVKNKNEGIELPSYPTYFNYCSETETAAVCMPGPDHVSIVEYGLNTNPPIADFEANLTTIHVGDYVDFTDLSINNPTSWEWSFEGGTPGTSSEEDPNVLYETDGVYDVSLIATNEYGSDTKLMEDYITVEIIDDIDYLDSFNEMSVYPNPILETLFVAFKEIPKEEINIAIFDINGRMLIAKKMIDKTNIIDAKRLEAGMYILKISTSQEKQVFKIRKE